MTQSVTLDHLEVNVSQNQDMKLKQKYLQKERSDGQWTNRVKTFLKGAEHLIYEQTLKLKFSHGLVGCAKKTKTLR